MEPESSSDPRWKSLKEWCQDYIAYCNDFGETPKNKNAVTEMVKKMGLVKVRRSDGMWYCMGVVEPETPKTPEKSEPDDLPDFSEMAAEQEAAIPF